MRAALETTEPFVDFTDLDNMQVASLMLPEELVNEHVIVLAYDSTKLKFYDDTAELTLVYDTFDASNINSHYLILFKFNGYSIVDGQLRAGLMRLTISGIRQGDYEDDQEIRQFEKTYENVLLTEASPIGLSKMLDRYEIREELYQLVTEMMK